MSLPAMSTTRALGHTTMQRQPEEVMVRATANFRRIAAGDVGVGMLAEPCAICCGEMGLPTAEVSAPHDCTKVGTRPGPSGRPQEEDSFHGLLCCGNCCDDSWSKLRCSPLYRIFCQAYSYGGTTGVGHDADKVEKMTKRKDRLITVKFNADRAASMRWNFKPMQTEIKVAPGETALAFYTAENPTDFPVIGISTYNVVPFEAGEYFNKIQCFCFEEQLLNPSEQVDMPVFFYIDPEFAEDPKMETVDDIILSYTFFEAKEGLKLPVPSFFKR